MKKQIVINSELCTGCGACEMACAIKKTGQCLPGIARIRVWREETRGLFIPMNCNQCVDPPCIQVCLMNVIFKDTDSGVTLRNLDICIGCRTCQVVCPFEGCRYDYLNDVVVNCDHCGGDPECVKYCPTGALKYGQFEQIIDYYRTITALKISELNPGSGNCERW